MKRIAILLGVFLFAVTPLFAVGRQTTFVPYSGHIIIDEWMGYENRNPFRVGPSNGGTTYHDIEIHARGYADAAHTQLVIDTIVELAPWNSLEMFPGNVTPAFDGFNNLAGTSGLMVLQRTIMSVQGIAVIQGAQPTSLHWLLLGVGTATGGALHTSTFEGATIIDHVTLGAAAPPSP